MAPDTNAGIWHRLTPRQRTLIRLLAYTATPWHWYNHLRQHHTPKGRSHLHTPTPKHLRR